MTICCHYSKEGLMNKNIHVGIYNTWADWEAGYALAHLGSGDWQPKGQRYQIVTVGETTSPVVTKAGITLTPDMVLEDLEPAESSMLMLPGADSWLVGENMLFVAMAARFLDAGVPVAAICGATVGLARGGLLNDVDHTSNAPQVLESVTYSGRDRYRYEGAVTDGNLITASAIAPVEFAREIFDRLGFYDSKTIDNWYLMYGKQDPAGFFGLMEGAVSG
jgi:putative intracellular protease/amidase